VELRAATVSTRGLSVRAKLDRSIYPSGIKISNDQLASAGVQGHKFQVEWNYQITPP
jgi:hypothetical protein